MRLSFNHSSTASQEGYAVIGSPMRILLIEDEEWLGKIMHAVGLLKHHDDQNITMTKSPR